MKKLFTLFGVFLVSLTLALTAADANAAKFGGKRSFGKSYRTAPAQQAQPVNSNKPAAAQPAGAGAKRGMLGGLMGGLLAGGLLAWLFGSGAFEGIQMMDMLILAGVAITALSGAVIGLLTYLADDQMLRNLSLWQMGSLAAGKPVDVGLALATLVALLWLFMRDANPLNALLLGEGEASHLGVNVQTLKRRLILLTAAGVGVAVAVAGMIGFVGLVVPHLVRLLAGPNHVRLLPLSALLGAALLLGADMLARTLLAPAELPVGIITALLGAPFFIWLLVKSRRTL